jgi:ribosomal protein S18 acetylase RimI-like enzyme
MRNLLVRKATIKDIPSIVKVRRAAFTAKEVQGFTTPEHSMFYSRQRMKKAWDKDDTLKGGWNISVAEDGGEVVGFIVFKIEDAVCYIDNINVAKAHQRKGLGKALVSHIERIAKSQGIRIMQTDTTENAEGTPWKSYTFWKKIGYRDTGERFPTKWAFKEIHFVKSL